MSSATALDRAGDSVPAGTQPLGDLLVLWQHPETRRIVPIGRFGFDGANYSFIYTRAAMSVEGFRALPGLPLGASYQSPRLPAAFEQRVMDRERPDFASYVTGIGLDPASATPWEQIMESGGSRAGDTLQFMQVPSIQNGRARARFLANGVRHIPEQALSVNSLRISVSIDEQEAALQRLTRGSSLLLEPENDNQHDSDATLITTEGTPVGWVPRALSRSIRELLSSGPVSVHVHRIGNPGTAPHLRLVLDLDIEAPPRFEFDHDGQWEPAPVQ